MHHGNKDTKTGYQEVVKVGDQKWEMVEITIGIIFYIWDSYLLFFIYVGNFQVPSKKITPTQSANSHPKSQFDLSPYYINLVKNGSFPNYEIPLDMSMYIFNCNKTVEAITLKCLYGHP